MSVVDVSTLRLGLSPVHTALNRWVSHCMVAGLLLCVFGSKLVIAGEEEPLYLGLFISARHYQGDDSLEDLEFTDDDVLRFLRTVRPLVSPEDVTILSDADPDVLAALAEMGWRSVTEPTREHFAAAVSALQSDVLRIKAEAPGREVRVLVYISSHGDVRGLHLNNGIVTAQQLQAALYRTRADSILLVADACFSGVWLKMKGKDRARYPDDEIAAALLPLERVGSITAQSGTREQESLVRGGLLTHVLSSAMLGAADLDGDRRVSYEEVEAYMVFHLQSEGAPERFRVHSPRKAPSHPPTLLSLDRLGLTAIEFGTSDYLEERYWITESSSGRMVAELVKRGGERRRIHLPTGTYRVQHFVLPNPWWGREGQVRVSDGVQVVQPSSLDKAWVWQGGKGAFSADIPMGIAVRPLSKAEQNYLGQSPFRSAVNWRDLPGQRQATIRLGSLLPLLPSLSGETSSRLGSWTMETSSVSLGGTVDWRVRTLGGPFLRVGVEASVQLSPGVQLGTDTGTVGTVSGGLRVGLERPIGAMSWRTSGVIAPLVATPLSHMGNEASSASGFLTGLMAAAEVGVGRRLARGRLLEAGLRCHLVLEPRRVGLLGEVQVLPYFGVGAFVGWGWLVR